MFRNGCSRNRIIRCLASLALFTAASGMLPVGRHILMKRVAAILLSVVLGCFAFYEFAIVAVCDGWYDLTVEIDPELAGDVSRVSYVGASNEDMAESLVPMVDDLNGSMGERDSVDPFLVNVGFSFRVSNPLGRTWVYGQQYSHIIVVLHRTDGSRAVHLLPVPHRNDSRRVIVTAASAAQHRPASECRS